MYYFVGWPTVLGSYCATDEFISLCSTKSGEYFVVCTATDLVLFHIKFICAIAHFTRSHKCLSENGPTSSAVWKEDSSKLLLSTKNGAVLIYSIENLQHVYEMFSESIANSPKEVFSLESVVKVAECMCNAFFLGDIVVISSENGDLIRMKWDGSYFGKSLTVKSISFIPDINSFADHGHSESQIYCRNIELASTFGGAFALFSSGYVALLMLSSCLADQSVIEGILLENATHSTCIAVNNRFRSLAVGTKRGEVLLYGINEISGTVQVQHTLQMRSPESCGTTENFGTVSEVIWSPDGYILAVAWSHLGWSLWSVFGALIYSSLSERLNPFNQCQISNLSWVCHGYNILGLVTFTGKCWIEKSNSPTALEGNDGIVESNAYLDRQDYHPSVTSYLVVFHLARSSITTNPTSDNHLHLVLQTDDRIILVNKDQMTTQVHTENLVVPKQYLIPNWPVRYVAVSMDGKKIAVSGRNGFVHYNSISHRWYSFGNVKQENSLHIVGGIAWWKQYICLSCISEDHGKSEVRVYPSERKLDDQFSSVCELGSLAQPVIVDNFQNWFLVLTNDGHLRSFGLAECVSNTVRISPFKEVDLSDIVNFPTCVLRICLSSLKSNTSIAVNYQSDAATTDPFSNSDPNYCTAESLLINYSGDLFLLQRLSSKVTHQNYSKKSSESNKQQLFFDKPLLVASKTEIVWSASCLQPAQSPQLDGFYLTSPDVHHINSYTKNSLWLYSGASGLSVWLLLPRITSSPFDINCESVALYSNKRFWVDHESSSTVSCRRIMLSFDLSDNFYPLSIFFQEELLVGIHNDFHFCWNKSTRGAGKSSFADIFTLFQYATLTVKVQIAHHQIIRQLLKRNLGNHASQMSLAYQNLTYFPHILELLLYEVLEAEAASKVLTPDPLLPQVVAFIQQFSNFFEILAHCSRKIDATWWPHLYAVIGRRPRDLFELCLENNQLETAASYLIILQTSEALSTSWECTLTLLRASIQAFKWDLIRDLLRFIYAIDPTEFNSSENQKVKQQLDKSQMLLLSSRNQISCLSTAEKNDIQSEVLSEYYINESIGYDEISKFPTPSSPPTLLDIESDAQCKDLSNTRELPLVLSVPAMKKSSFNLRAQVEQLLCKVAVEYFSQGYLNRASHLVTNIPEIFVDGSYFGQANVLALWLMKNASYLKPVLTWPKAFLNLMEDFDVFGHTLECSKKNPSSFTLKEKSILQSNNVSQAANAILTSEDSTYNLDSSRRTVRNETFCQLRYLLNQLTIAKCYEWMCLISLLCLDKNALLRSLSIAVYNTTLSDTSHLQRESVHPHTTVVNNPHQANLGVILDPMSSTKSSFNETSGLNVGLRPHHTLCFFDDNLSRLITGLAAVKQWSREKYPLYHQFLISFEPVLNEFLSQLQLFLKEKNDISIGSPNFNVFVKRGIIPNTHVEQVTEINSPAASNASDTDSFQYSKLQREISNCSFAEPSKAVEKVSFHLNYPSTFDTMFHLEHNKVDQSLLLNSSSRSRRDYLDKFVSPTPVMLNSDNLNEKHWTSIDHFLPSGSSAALSITDSNEHLFNGTTEDSSFQSETSEKWTCSIT